MCRWNWKKYGWTVRRYGHMRWWWGFKVYRTSWDVAANSRGLAARWPIYSKGWPIRKYCEVNVSEGKFLLRENVAEHFHAFFLREERRQDCFGKSGPIICAMLTWMANRIVGMYSCWKWSALGSTTARRKFPNLSPGDWVDSVRWTIAEAVICREMMEVWKIWEWSGMEHFRK